MESLNRRHDIDWVRVIAIGLLLLYHTAIGFQPWGTMIGFIVCKESWMSLWTPMTMLNIWRIPLLFFVSGMGVYFSIQNRNWKQLLRERALRIVIPFFVGVFVIVPLGIFLVQSYYGQPLFYIYHPGHLWFLGNIFVYVVLLLPVFFYLKNNEKSNGAMAVKKLFGSPAGLLFVFAAFAAEALIVDPVPFELYAMTWHGFFLGLLGFLFGFCFMLSGDAFWNMILSWRWLLILAALSFYVFRLIQFKTVAPGYVMAIESNFWILAVFAFGFRYLNRPGKALDYLSQAVYPVYILHMIFLYLGSMLVFRGSLDVRLQFLLVLLVTILGSFISYELVRRISVLRPVFGLSKMRRHSTVKNFDGIK